MTRRPIAPNEGKATDDRGRNSHISTADNAILMRMEAKLLRKRAEVVEARGGKVVKISPSMARRLSDHLLDLERLREGGGDDR